MRRDDHISGIRHALANTFAWGPRGQNFVVNENACPRKIPAKKFGAIIPKNLWVKIRSVDGDSAFTNIWTSLIMSDMCLHKNDRTSDATLPLLFKVHGVAISVTNARNYPFVLGGNGVVPTDTG